MYAVPSNVLPEAALKGASATISCVADAKVTGRARERDGPCWICITLVNTLPFVFA